MVGDSASVAWINLVKDILERGSECRPRGLRCRELLGYQTKVDMSRPIVTVAGRKLGYRFMAAEAWWILSGRNDVASISPYSRHIASFSNDGYHFDGAYGPRIVDQLRYVVDCLTSDPDSRQAVIEIWRPNPRPSRDVPCTVSVQFLVRDGAIHCVDTMRSSDAWLGWPYDVFNFSMLSAYVALLISARTNYSQKAYKLGTLTLTAGSQHLYVNPPEDGSSNIPYTLADAERIVSGLQQISEYKRLDLDDFTPYSLLRHLALSKDGQCPGGWMEELLSK